MKKFLPPKVHSFPYVGTMLNFQWQQLNFLSKARATHGDIFRLQLGKTEITVLGHPQYAAHVLHENASNYRNKGEAGFRIAPLPLMKSGLATAVQAKGDWQNQKKIVHRYFKKQTEFLTELMVEAIEEGMSSWQTERSSNPIDLEPLLTRLSIHVIVKTVFGTTISLQQADKIAHEFRYIMDYLWWCILSNMVPNWVPVPGWKRYQQAIGAVDGCVAELIEHSRKKGKLANNLIYKLFQGVQNGNITEEQLHNEAVTLLVAGYESIAANLSWTFHLLAQSSEVAIRIKAEVDAVLGKRKLTFANIAQLSYTRRVVQESLRLYAPSYWLQRMAEEDDEINGFHIPAGGIVVPMIYLIHSHPEIWENPSQFNPQRFMPEYCKNRHRFAWLPFGAGQRKCVAIEFSLVQEQLILALIFQRYNLTPQPERTTKEHVGSNIRPKGGVWFSLHPRTQ